MEIQDPRQPIVKATQLRKHYGTITAVSGIDFSIHRNQCFGFLGPNGAGKTTTLRMLLGLTPLSAGELRLFEFRIPEGARNARARIGVVPQGDNLDPDFSVVENLYIYASYFGLSRKQVSSRIQELLELVALRDRAAAKTESLSGGMKRRLSIARALINRPELVVLDEPTTGLDPQARHNIWSKLSELRDRGTTLILTTHYMEEAERLCDQLVIMDHGKILAQGTPTELVQRYVEPEVVEIRGKLETPMLDALKQMADCRIEPLGTSVYCYASNTNAMVQALKSQTTLSFIHRPCGLEDVFLKLTGRELRD